MKKLWLTVLSVVVISALTACGAGEKATGNTGSDSAAETGDAAGEAVELAVEATNFKFDQTEYRVKAGETVKLKFTSGEGMHGLEVKGLDIELQDGQSSTFVAKKGEYELVCSIMCGAGHADMVSKLIVE